jgi:drug/metabolite transporter (DMT)-like permease
MPETTPVLTKLRITAILQALLVTVLWSSSMILIKFGFKAGLPPITFAGLRYWCAFLCLAVLILFNPSQRKVLRTISRPTWIQLIVLGLIFYTITQGANFLGLSLLPANTISLVFNFAPLLIAIASTLLTREKPYPAQWLGVLLSIAGALVYFLPLGSVTGNSVGIVVALIGLLACSVSSLLGRHVNLRGDLPPILITTISMGIGGSLLLLVGGITQGFGYLDLTQWLIIAWLAIVNTAFAFTLWNKTLRTLTSVESSIINNLILPQVAVLSWLFLDEKINTRQILGILFVMLGTLIVQLRRRTPRDEKFIEIMAK